MSSACIDPESSPGLRAVLSDIVSGLNEAVVDDPPVEFVHTLLRIVASCLRLYFALRLASKPTRYVFTF